MLRTLVFAGALLALSYSARAEDRVTVRRIDPNSREARYLESLIDDNSKGTVVRTTRLRSVREQPRRKFKRAERHGLLPWWPNAPGD